MPTENERIIEDYLRVAQTGDLSHEEICSVIKVHPKKMQFLLTSEQYKTYINEKSVELGCTMSALWSHVDVRIRNGDSDELISYFFELPIRQVRFRRHYLEKKLI